MRDESRIIICKLFGILLCVSFSFSLSAQTWNLITTATASDASASSYFGSAVAMDGDYAVSRAAGAIYIFKRDRTTYAWTQKQKIMIPGSYNYGNGSVAISGNHIAVIGGDNVTTGSLYIFQRDSTNDTWAQQKVLTPSDATGFSGAVSISGNYIVAGATSESEDANGSNTISMAGAAYIYELASGIWTEQQKIVANSNRNAHSYFGSSVAICGDVIVIGASGYDPYKDDYECIVGNAYVFERNAISDLWSTGYSIFTGTDPGFGGVDKTITALVSSVSIGKKYIAVGSYKNISTEYYGGYTQKEYYNYMSGAVSIYTKNSAGYWNLQQTLYDASPYNGCLYNDESNPYINSLSISGEYLCYSYSSRSYLYKKNPLENWALLQTFPSKNSIGLKNEDLVLGNEEQNTNTGGIIFYKSSPYFILSSNTSTVGSTKELTTSVNLIYNTPFTATSNQPWLSISPNSVSPVVVSDTIPLIFSASANNTTNPRIAKVTISGTGVSNQYVIVTQLADPVITWADPVDITYGTALTSTQLNATANVEGTFTYTPSLGTELNAGTAQTLRVDFTPKDTANYSSASKIVQINVKKVVPIILWANPTDIIYGTALSNAQLNATSNVVGTYTYNPMAGTKLDAGSGQTLSVRFTPIDTVNFESVSKAVQINVKLLIKPEITWTNPADITYGTALTSTQLNATANVEGTFTYTPSIGTLLNAGTAQTLRVDFTPKDTANYSSASKIVQINVKKVVPAISWTTPADIIYGTVLSNAQLNATSNVVGTYTYNPMAGTKLDAGSGQTLSVRFTPIDTVNFESVSKTVQINVKKVTPVITWSNPADIYYGDTLSSTQLNATANVEGTFTYSPAIGTKLNVGNGQILSTQFKASDEINYELVSKQVSINVIQPILSLSTSAVNISFTGRETSTITINSNSPWIATSDQQWLTVSSSSGTGNGTIILSAAENTNAFDRTAKVTIQGAGQTTRTISVNQSKLLETIAKISRKWNDVLVCNNSDNLFIDYQWYKNDVAITGETKQYYQELGGLDGSYYVKVTQSDGISGISNTINFSLASKSIKAYPNPIEDRQNFNLEIKATESDLKQAELTISSVSGQIILRNSNLQQQMKLNGLSSGCYIIHLRLTNGELLNEKIMVK